MNVITPLSQDDAATNSAIGQKAISDVVSLGPGWMATSAADEAREDIIFLFGVGHAALLYASLFLHNGRLASLQSLK